jgi:PAS domain S-box-containing protein
MAASDHKDAPVSAARIKALEKRLAEAEANLDAIRSGKADAIVVQTEAGISVFTIQGAESAYRIMVETMNEGAITVDADGVILFSNTRFCTMLGLHCSALGGKPLASLIAAHQHPDFARFLQQAVARRNAHRDFELVTHDGGILPAYLSATLLEIVGRHDICIVATDLTERMEAKRQLMELNAALELKVAQRTQQLQQRTVELESSQHDLEKLTQSLEQQVERRTVQVRALARELTLAEQKQRQRLSTILHEDLQQVLLSVRTRFVLLRETIANGSPEDIDEDIDELERLLAKALDTTKRLAIEFNPPVLANEGLDAALKWLAEHMHKRYGLQIDVAISESFTMIREEERVLLVQLVRELLHNVVRHAGTVHARLTVSRDEKYIAIEVADAGVGFDVRQKRREARKNKQYGLFSIEERLRLIGGCLRIDSSPGHGTLVQMMVPFNPERRQLSVE